MLLSLVGEPNRLVHQGAELAIALLTDPDRSVVLRTLWRVKDKKLGPGLGSNKRPDFQELLSDVRLSVWVRMGRDSGAVTLLSRLLVALGDPGSVKRFGGLSLGESTMLVDEVRRWREGDPTEGSLLLHDGDGDLSLPVWPDHVGSKGTRWGQYKLGDKARLPVELPESAWTRICPPDAKDD
jgi:CRISPR-associated protein Cas5t